MFDAVSQLATYRQTIDNLDAALVYILAERFRCTDEVGLLKAKYELSPVDQGREDRQYSRLRKLARDSKVDEGLIESLMKSVIKEVVRRHRQIAAEYTSGRISQQ